MQLKFICLNLWPLSELFEDIVAFLEQENADLLFLQEVFNGHDPQLPPKQRAVDELTRRLGYAHAHFEPAFIEDFGTHQLDQGNAILSRFPLKPMTPTFYDVPYGLRNNTVEGFPFTPRNLQHAQLQLPHMSVDLFNTQGIWGEDGKDSARRLQMSQTIIDHIKDKEAVILAGDFNVDQHTQTVYNIEKHLHNVFKDELVTSFNMRQKDNPGFATAVVDMVFVTPNIRVVEHTCPQVDVSDHLPLVCTFEVAA